MKAAILISYCLFACIIYIKAQTPVVDSIRKEIFSAKDNRQKLAAILDYCDQYQSLNKDSAYNYALLAVMMSKQSKDEKSKARAALAFANSYYLWGWVDSASAVCDSALEIYTADNVNTRDIYFKLMRQKAMCYGGVQKFPEALDVLYKLLREAEQYQDSVTIASTCNTIGSINIGMDKPGEALKWISRALAYDTKNEKFIPVQAAVLTNASYAYMNDGNNDSAMRYINKALPLCREVQNLNTLATALRIRSNLYVNEHKNSDAEKDLREMLSIRRTLNGGNNSNIIEDNIQLANFYAQTNQLEKAIAICKESIKNGDIYNTGDSVAYNNHLNNKLEYYKALAGFYKQAGMNNEYAATMEEIIAAKDSFYASNNALAIAEVQTKYETEQKEKTILQQKYDLAKKNFILYGSLALVLLAGIIFYLLFRDYSRRQKIKAALARQQEQVAKQIAVKEAEEKERRRIAADLHDNLGVQANAILYNAELLKSEAESNDALVDDLHDTAKQMLLNLRETLWAMKTNDIAATELWLRIISFAKQMGRHYTQIHFTTQGLAPQEMQLYSAKALNIVMVVQEAVQNAVKHSNAKEILITSQAVGNEWEINVKDNGEGFEYENAFAKIDSHGLKNMKERAKANNLQLKFSSNTEGTNMQLKITADEIIPDTTDA